MKPGFKLFCTVLAITFLAGISTYAESGEKMVIALKTDNFDLTETDISSLAIGEAKTIETESGQVIDIIRTTEGAEIYVDGELLDLNLDDEDLHEGHVIKKHVEVTCDDEEDCDEHVVIVGEGESQDVDLDELLEQNPDGEVHKVIVIKKKVDIED